ncbi:hypothetical protein SAMD00023353_6500660 [Rosellinia necatrix]|uniref:Uncharacterized protein n=1 Tax=Rosellinia necatrix TaxID=77044 RepID=A0A1W2TSN0_ROSNE|nr:hypothetical protein SAMD00023353_6500660 [Rosellinia necatrix]
MTVPPPPPPLPTLTDQPTRYPGCCASLSEPLLATIASLLSAIIPTTNPPTDGDVRDGDSPSPGDEDNDDGDNPPPTLTTEPVPPLPLLLLSVGSGTGLLEELLHAHLNRPREAGAEAVGERPWRVEGVEVRSSVNVHLPGDRVNHVPGTWALHEGRARAAAALLFAYPRDGRLVRRYVEALAFPSSAAPAPAPAVPVGVEVEVGAEGRSRRGDAAPSPSPSPLVLWLGPKCDWEDTGLACFSGGGRLEDDGDDATTTTTTTTTGVIEVLELRSGVGLAEYEMLAALRRRGAQCQGWGL